MSDHINITGENNYSKGFLNLLDQTLSAWMLYKQNHVNLKKGKQNLEEKKYFDSEVYEKKEEDKSFKLEAILKNQFEQAFEADFSNVTIHTGPYAHQIARSNNALAVTVGDKDIYFADGQFAPHSDEGIQLIAHELQHIVQQQNNFSFEYLKDIQKAEEEALKVETELKGLKLHSLKGGVLKQNRTGNFNRESLEDAREEAFDEMTKEPINPPGDLEELSRRNNRPGIQFISPNGKSYYLSQKQYEMGLEIIKENFSGKIEEARMSMTEEEFSDFILKLINSSKNFI